MHGERIKSYMAEWREKNRDHTTAYERRRSLRLKYGMTEEDYDALLAAQDGKCAACGSTDAGSRYARFHVDHDHLTGAVRALLCLPCNVALGKVRDDPERLLALARYLLSFQDVLHAGELGQLPETAMIS